MACVCVVCVNMQSRTWVFGNSAGCVRVLLLFGCLLVTLLRLVVFGCVCVRVCGLVIAPLLQAVQELVQCVLQCVCGLGAVKLPLQTLRLQFLLGLTEGRMVTHTHAHTGAYTHTTHTHTHPRIHTRMLTPARKHTHTCLIPHL